MEFASEHASPSVSMESLNSRDTSMNKSESILSKREEIAPNLGLFDRPRLKQPTPQEAEQ
jgi:hypothetical protein